MDFSSSKIILKKINTLFDSAENFGNKFSSLEKDLFLHYMRELYEEVSKPDLMPVQDSPNIMTHQNSAQKESFHRENSENISSNNRSHEPQYVPPRQTENISAYRSPEPISEPSRMQSFNGVHEKPKEMSAYRPTHAPAVEVQQARINPELDELFHFEEIGDLTNRFGQSPVTDLSRSMGINERILTINELFDGNQLAFNECVSRLNVLSSYEQAVAFLSDNAASQYAWAMPQKKHKAQNFLKLIKRRYPK